MKKNWLWIASTIAVVIIFHVCYGLKTLIPTNISWLMTAMHDWGTHYLGFYFYKSEAWHFPLGAIHNYFYPIGTNVGFTDSIPLLAIFFKLFRVILPEDFQYFGIWLLLCHLLAAYFSIKLFKLFKVRQFYTFLAVVFIAANPVLVYRGLHPALCAHWLLLACLYLYFKPVASLTQANKILLHQFILLLLGALINPYICFMILGFTVATPLKLAFCDQVLKRKKFFIYLGTSLFSLLIIWYLVGFIDFTNKEDLGVRGAYGLYSLNLNALYNASGFSSLLPPFKQISWHQYEGFMYLGAGMGILIAITLLIKIIERIKRKQKHLNFFVWNGIALLPLIILIILYTLFSITHIISINDKVLFTIPIPQKIVQLGDVFRASARFFWMPYYLFILATFIILARVRMAESIRIFIIVFALLVQLYDTKKLLTFRELTYGSYEPPLDKSWRQLIKQFDEIVFYPPFQASYKSDLDYQYFSFLAAHERKPINIGYVARANNKAISIVTDSLNRTLEKGYLSPRTLYVTTGTYLKQFATSLQTENGQLNTLDNYYYLFSRDIENPLLLNLSNQLNKENKTQLDSGLAIIGNQIQFYPVQKIAVENNKIKFFIEKMNDGKKYLTIDGWAFLEGTRNNKGDSIFFTLDNDDKFYMAQADIKQRPDIITQYKLALGDAGFNGIIFKDNVERGVYRLGIAIKNTKGNVVHQVTDKIIRVGIADYTIPQKISALPANKAMIYGIDLFEKENDFVKVNGWAAIENMDAVHSKTSIILKNANAIYMADTEPVLRPDVTGRPGNKYNLDNSGFSSKILKAQLPKGKYQIGILIKNTHHKNESFIMTDKELEVL